MSETTNSITVEAGVSPAMPPFPFLYLRERIEVRVRVNDEARMTNDESMTKPQ
jgi:hypothetical protein